VQNHGPRAMGSPGLRLHDRAGDSNGCGAWLQATWVSSPWDPSKTTLDATSRTYLCSLTRTGTQLRLFTPRYGFKN